MQKEADALIMAAGKGERFGGRKQFLLLDDSTIVQKSVKLFENIDEIKNIIVVYPPDMEEDDVREKGMISSSAVLVKGGVKRADSVMNGLSAVTSGYVLIHDAVRPVCSKDLVKRMLAAVFKYGAVVPGINPFDTVKFKVGDELKTIDRNLVYLIQTPQGFKTDLIKKAYESRKNSAFTDSSSIAENAGIRVKIVEGERDNIKITVPGDIKGRGTIWKD